MQHVVQKTQFITLASVTQQNYQKIVIHEVKFVKYLWINQFITMIFIFPVYTWPASAARTFFMFANQIIPINSSYLKLIFTTTLIAIYCGASFIIGSPGCPLNGLRIAQICQDNCRKTPLKLVAPRMTILELPFLAPGGMFLVKDSGNPTKDPSGLPYIHIEGILGLLLE